MRVTKRRIARHTVAILCGCVAFVIAHILKEYVMVWLGDYATFFLDYLLTAIIFELPLYLLAAITASVAYHFVLRPIDDTETRCRKCGYILKGLSKPECPECGEVI